MPVPWLERAALGYLQGRISRKWQKSGLSGAQGVWLQGDAVRAGGVGVSRGGRGGDLRGCQMPRSPAEHDRVG